MKRAMLPILFLLFIIPSVPTVSDALTVQFFQCGNSSCSSLTQLGSTLTVTSQVNIAGTRGNLVITDLSSTALANVALSQTSSIKNVKLSNALIKATAAGTYLIRMLSDDGYNPQPGGVNYQNSVGLNGSWVGTGTFTSNTIKVVLTANFGNTAYQTSVDQTPASPTVTVQYNSDGKSFTRSLNTKGESIFLPSSNLVCTNPSTGLPISTCGRNRHRKDLMITFTAANQTVNMGESLVGVASESEIQQGGRAEVNRFLLCPGTPSQFQAGTTEVEKAYVVFPHAPLKTQPDKPNNAPPNIPIQFDATLTPRDGTNTLVSIPLPPDTDLSNDSQFNLFLPCLTSTPVTFQGLFNLTAVFPAPPAFTVGGEPSANGDCEGTLRWVINLVDSKGVPHVVQVLYGDVGNNFNGCASFSGVNMLATGDARFLLDGDLLPVKLNQLNSHKTDIVTSIKLLLDGRLVTGPPLNLSSPIDITVTLTNMRVNNDSFSFPTQSQVAVCPPAGPDHGFEILITRTDPSGFSNLIPQSRIDTSGCKISVNADTATDFGGPGAYMVEVLNNETHLDEPGFIALGP